MPISGLNPPKEQTQDHYYNIPEGSSERYEKRIRRIVDKGRNTIHTNPCFYEGEKSLKCKNDQKDDCTQYFENFRACRKFWTRVMRDRKRKGIEPDLPIVEDRDKVREEYKHFLPGQSKNTDSSDS